MTTTCAVALSVVTFSVPAIVLNKGGAGEAAALTWFPAVDNEDRQTSFGKRQSHQGPANASADDQHVDNVV